MKFMEANEIDEVNEMYVYSQANSSPELRRSRLLWLIGHQVPALETPAQSFQLFLEVL